MSQRTLPPALPRSLRGTRGVKRSHHAVVERGSLRAKNGRWVKAITFLRGKDGMRVSSAGFCGSPTSHSHVVVLKTGNNNRKNTPATGESKTKDFVLWTSSPPPRSPPYTHPCLKICVGALLSEHDVLSSKSCSHLPRHIHEHTLTHTLSRSLFHLSFSGQRFVGVSFPSLSCVLFCFCSGHTFWSPYFQPQSWSAPLSIISE